MGSILEAIEDWIRGLLVSGIIAIEYGGYFGGTEKRTITFDGEKILVEKEHMLRIPSPEELQEDPADEFRGMEKAEFLEALADFHLGEWEKRVRRS